MAANFGNTILDGTITPSVQLQAPVQDRSGEVFATAMQPVFGTVGAIAGSIFKQNQTDVKTKVLSGYQNDLLDLADSVDQGMDKDEAMIRARTLRRQYLANSPALQTDFDKVWSDFAGANGLGHVVVEGTVEQQAVEAKNSEAIKLGYTPQEYDVFLARSRELKAQNDHLEAIKNQGGIVTETLRNRSLQSVVGLADSAFPAAQTQINKAMSDISANPENKAAIVQQLNLNLGQNIQQLSSITGPAGADYITTPISGLLDTFNKWAGGGIENDIMEAAIKKTGLQYQTMYSNDPVLGPIIAQSKLLNDLGLAQSNIGISMWTPDALQRLRGVAEGNVNLLDNTPGSNKFVGNIKATMGAVTDTTDPGTIEEIKAARDAAVEGAYVNERSAKDGAVGFKDTVEMLGSPENTEFTRRVGPVKTPNSDKFIGVLKANYENELLPAIQKYWESVPVMVPSSESAIGANVFSNIPMNQLLEPVWNGNAVEFMPKDAYKDNPRIVSLASDVNAGNSSIGVPLNNLINAYANVSGTDAKTIWETDLGKRLFNLGPDGKPIPASISDRVNKALDAPKEDTDTFTLGDFQADKPEVEFTNQASVLGDTGLPPLDPANTSVSGVDYDSYLPSIRASESGGNDSAKNSTSTATGRYQFLKSTWTDLVNRYPNSGLTYEGRTDPQQQEAAIRLFTAENARYLNRQGVPLTNGTLYAAHFLGAQDAVQVLKAGEGLVSDYVPKRVVNANKFLRGMSIAQFRAWANRKGNA